MLYVKSHDRSSNPKNNNDSVILLESLKIVENLNYVESLRSHEMMYVSLY